MTIKICDKCGKNITEEPGRYIVAQSKSKPNEEGEAPARDWLMVKDVCMDCAKEIEKLFQNGVNKPRTNADRVRNMDDAELAKHLSLCPVKSGEEDCIHSNDDVHCFDCILDWLQSEVKE